MLPTRKNLSSAKATHSQWMCEAVSVTIWHLLQIGLSIEEPVLQGFFWWLSQFIFSVDFLWSMLVPKRTGDLNSQHPQSLMWVEGIHTTRCCPVPRRDYLTVLSPPQCHAAFGMMPSILASVDQSPVCHPRTYPPLQQQYLGLDFGEGPAPKHHLNFIGGLATWRKLMEVWEHFW
jgi:hypothetical protein